MMLRTNDMLLALLVGCNAALVSAEPPAMPVSKANEYLSQGKNCCGALALALPDKVSYTGSVAFNESLSSYWSVQEQYIRPTCVVTPTTSLDVALAVSLLNVGGSVFPGECDFAVRSGGHTPFAGAANAEEGITIDLSRLNQVTSSSNLSTVTIGPGNRWQNVYSQLDALGIAIGGGRVGTVGAGGLTLGGGLSFFSPRYGFVCDNVVRYEVVLPCGTLVNATQDSYSDLWLALKGGSNNFGIVTAFESTSFKQGKFWGGFIFNNIDTKDRQFAAFEALTGSTPYDPYAALINTYVYLADAKFWLTASNLEYTDDNFEYTGNNLTNVTSPPVFQNFTSLPQLSSTMRVSNLTDFTLELAGTPGTNRRQLFVTGTYGNSAKLMSSIFDISNRTVQSLSVPGMTYSLSFQPMPTAITSKAASRGGNSLGLTGAEGNLFTLLLTVSWDSVADDERIEQHAKALFQQSEDKARELGVYSKYVYLNYAASWQDPISGYGAAQKARLQDVSRKYDPKGVFQKQVAGGFKLFD